MDLIVDLLLQTFHFIQGIRTNNCHFYDMIVFSGNRAGAISFNNVVSGSNTAS